MVQRRARVNTNLAQLATLLCYALRMAGTRLNIPITAEVDALIERLRAKLAPKLGSPPPTTFIVRMALAVLAEREGATQATAESPQP
jgi:hypothetical protein